MGRRIAVVLLCIKRELLPKAFESGEVYYQTTLTGEVANLEVI